MNSRLALTIGIVLASCWLTAAAMGEVPFPPPNGENPWIIEGPEGVVRVAPLAEAPPQPSLPSIPADAQKLVSSFNAEVADIQRKARQEIAAKQAKLIEQLTKLQDAYSKPGTLDEAVAIRDRIRQLKLGVHAADAKPDPGNLTAFRQQIGQVFLFRVTGNNAVGVVWGTDIYTDDSRLAAAAVHAGVLRHGEQGVVKVTMQPGQAAYPASVRHCVSSQPWQNWGASYRVEAP